MVQVFFRKPVNLFCNRMNSSEIKYVDLQLEIYQYIDIQEGLKCLHYSKKNMSQLSFSSFDIVNNFALKRT